MLNFSFLLLIPGAIWKAAAVTWQEDSDWKGSIYDSMMKTNVKTMVKSNWDIVGAGNWNLELTYESM